MSEAVVYADFVRAHMPEAGLRELERLIERDGSAYESEWAREIEARAKAEAILDLLDLREVEVPEAISELILRCTDLAQIQECFQRAASAETVDDLFD